MKHTTRTSAFTLIEVIFVIVILGVVASIGSKIIAQVYESYIVQRAQYRAAIKTELALNQIANRLRYAIPGTVGARVSLTSTFIPITNTLPEDSKVLQWVGADGDSFEAIASAANLKPGWSGFCDLDLSTANNIVTPGSNLALTTSIISNLDASIANARIYFPYEGNNYGIANGNGENIVLDADQNITVGQTIYERYKLAWSSYAIEVRKIAGVNKLLLHHHFAPQAKIAINGNSTSTVLINNVTNFRFKGSEGVLRVKICVEEQVGFDSDKIHTCKERVIF